MTILILICAVCAFAQTGRDEGIDLYQKGDYAGAITLLESAVKTDAKDRDAWLFLRMSRVRAKKGNAFKAFDKGKNLSADNSYYDQEVKIASKPKPPYADTARQNQVSGKVKLAVEFGADGKIVKIYSLQALPYGLTENSVAAATEIEFESARKNGAAVTAIRIIEYTFEIY